MRTFEHKTSAFNPLIHQKTNPSLQKKKEESFFKPVIQAKLTVGSSHDKYEVEADKVADRVMNTSDRSAIKQSTAPMKVQKKCADCENDDKEKKIHKKSTEKTAEQEAPAMVNDVLKSEGRPLDKEVRRHMEPRFGYDFSQVRIHTDTRAAKSADSIQAKAYTSGNKIVFASGKYQPNTNKGRKLIAHELTHVLQQRRSHRKVQRLVRTSSVHCGAGQNPFSADRRAAAMLEDALTVIDAAIAHIATPADANVVRLTDALWRAFRMHLGNAHIANDIVPILRRRISLIRDNFNSIVYDWLCAPNGVATPLGAGGNVVCAAGINAWSRPGDLTHWVLCPSFWGQDVTGRAGTLIHESTHMAFNYGDWGAGDFNNAHCFRQFVMILNGTNNPAALRCH